VPFRLGCCGGAQRIRKKMRAYVCMCANIRWLDPQNPTFFYICSRTYVMSAAAATGLLTADRSL